MQRHLARTTSSDTSDIEEQSDYGYSPLHSISLFSRISFPDEEGYPPSTNSDSGSSILLPPSLTPGPHPQLKQMQWSPSCSSAPSLFPASTSFTNSEDNVTVTETRLSTSGKHNHDETHTPLATPLNSPKKKKAHMSTVINNAIKKVGSLKGLLKSFRRPLARSIKTQVLLSIEEHQE